MLDTLHRTHR